MEKHWRGHQRINKWLRKSSFTLLPLEGSIVSQQWAVGSWKEIRVRTVWTPNASLLFFCFFSIINCDSVTSSLTIFAHFLNTEVESYSLTSFSWEQFKTKVEPSLLSVCHICRVFVMVFNSSRRNLHIGKEQAILRNTRTLHFTHELRRHTVLSTGLHLGRRIKLFKVPVWIAKELTDWSGVFWEIYSIGK